MLLRPAALVALVLIASATPTRGQWAAPGTSNGTATGVACSSCVTLGAETAGNYVDHLWRRPVGLPGCR